MKTLIKSLILVAAMLAVSAKAETLSTALATGTNVLKASQSLYLTSVQFANGTGSAVTVELFDAPTNVLTYSVGAYTNHITYTSNVVSTVVGFNGSTNSFTNQVLVTVANSVSSATPAYRSITKVAIPANSSLTVPINTLAAFGVVATNNGVATVTMTYEKLIGN
jgi:hypothetical protein